MKNRGKIFVAISALAVVSIVSTIWIFRHWDFISELAGFILIATICATIFFFVARAMEGQKSPLIGGLVVFLVIFLYGYSAASFDCQMRKLEREFDFVANHSSYDVVWHGDRNDLDFRGNLTEILARRDELLLRYHREMCGRWWVSTDGVEIDAHYRWKF